MSNRTIGASITGAQLFAKHPNRVLDDAFSLVEAGANQAATGANALPHPTEAQAIAGNYRMGTVRLFDLPVIRIENVRGSYREGTAPDGTQWRTRLAAHYGYFAGTRGADGDAIDVFVGPFPESESAWVINQRHVDGQSGFDEHKCMVGFHTKEQARDAYMHSFDRGWTGLASIVPVSINQLKWWLKFGNHKLPITAETLPFDGENTMLNKVLWDSNAQPVTSPLHRVMYDLRVNDADAGLMLDACTMADYMADPDIEAVPVYDALVVEVASMTRKMALLQKTMEAAGITVKPTEMTVADPVKSRGVLQVMVLFSMSDGQTVSIWFHNPDTTPAKLTPMDELISWKWMINKKDVTIVVAPERGTDLNVREVSRRVMRLVEKNSEAFQKANAKAGERAAITEALKTEIVGLEGTLAGLQRQIELAKVSKDDSAANVSRQIMALQAKQDATFKLLEAEKAFGAGADTVKLEELMNQYDDLADQIRALRGEDATGRTSWATWQELRAAEEVRKFPAWSEYQNLKSQNPSALLLHRMGDFYEAMGDDAKPVADALDLTLTSRNGVAMAGFMTYSLENFVKVLTANGFAVAVSDRDESGVSSIKEVFGTVAPEIDPTTPDAWVSPLVSVEGLSVLTDSRGIAVSSVSTISYASGEAVTLAKLDSNGVSALLRWAPIANDNSTGNYKIETMDGGFQSEGNVLSDVLDQFTMAVATILAPTTGEGVTPIATVDAAYKFDNATDAFKEWIADSVTDVDYSPFASASAMDKKAKELGANVAWDVSFATLDSAKEEEEGEDFDPQAEFDSAPELDDEDNEVEPVMDGDFRGHPFRGNQHKKAGRASGAAVNASIRAKTTDRRGDAKSASKAHETAHHAHKAAFVEATGKAKKYHKVMAAFHGTKAGLKLDDVNGGGSGCCIPDGEGATLDDSANWHSKTMEEMKRKDDDALRFILKDATQAAEAGEKFGNPKSGQYRDEAHYASMEIQRRKKGGTQVMDSAEDDAPAFPWMLDDAGEFPGTVIGVITKDGVTAGRAHIGGDGKAMVFTGAEGVERIKFPSGRAATWSDDDADLMIETLLVTPKDRADMNKPAAGDTDASRLNAADALVSKDAIMSDDPKAIEKLDIKLTALRMRQEFMKKANKFFKKGDDAGLLAMGLTQGQINKMKGGDFAGRTGFADYLLTNNNGVMAATRKRMDALIAAKQKEAAVADNETRDPRDVASDPEGLAIVDPGAPLVAAETSDGEVAPAVADPAAADQSEVIDPIKAVDTAYLETFTNGTADMFAADILERLEPMFSKYENDAPMMDLLNRAAEAYSDAAVKAAQAALAS